MSLDAVTFGEVMGMMLATPGTPLRHARAFTRSFAGAEATVAVGMARLGHRVGWCGRVGDDPFGLAALDTLRAEGVDLSRAVVDPDAPTGLLVRDAPPGRRVTVQYYRAGSAASRMTEDHLDLDYLCSARLLHVTGITPALGAGCHRAVVTAMRAARAAGVVVAFDPNIRLRLWSAARAAEVLGELVGLADIVLSGLDEAALITGQDEPAAVAALLLARGARLVVLKLGERGSWASDGTNVWHRPSRPVAVVDPVGAGDAFDAAFLSGYLRGVPVPEALAAGNLAGALSVQAAGDLDGLPYPADLVDFESDVDR
jgi:2-dehydro-3-deoxygluconokinase